MAKVLTIGFENMDTMATVEAILTGMGIKYLVKDLTPTVEEAQIMAQKMADESNCSCMVTARDEKGELVEVSAKPKKAEKKSAPKKESKSKAKTSTKKGSEDFDYELYKAIAEQLGVYGKHGCYRFARPTVKSLMQHPEYLTKSGKLQAKVKKSTLATLLTVAQTDGIQWYIDSVASGKVAKVQ